MDDKYAKIVDILIAELLDKYVEHLKKTENEYEYCAIVTAALVFKELALLEFKKNIIRNTNDDPEDICKLVEVQAVKIAEQMRKRSIPQRSIN